MQVDPKKPASSSSYQGKTYCFCSAGSKRKFDRYPEHNANKQLVRPSRVRVRTP